MRRRRRSAPPRPARLSPPAWDMSAGGLPLLRHDRVERSPTAPLGSEREIEAAARAVGAHDFIAELPGGYLHELAERGRRSRRASVSCSPCPGRAGRSRAAAARRGHIQSRSRDRGAGGCRDATPRQGENTIVIAHRLATAQPRTGSWCSTPALSPRLARTTSCSPAAADTRRCGRPSNTSGETSARPRGALAARG